MVASNAVNPANVLRLYVWELLKNNLDTKVLDFVTITRDGKSVKIIPVIPIEDEPDLRESGKNYIIYGWSENEETSSDQVERGNVAFRIIANSTNELNLITNTLARGLNDEDNTASSVNYWSTRYANSALIGIRFTWVKTILVESADPAESEGGETEGNVMVGYRFVSDQKVLVYQPDGTWQ